MVLPVINWSSHFILIEDSTSSLKQITTEILIDVTYIDQLHRASFYFNPTYFTLFQIKLKACNTSRLPSNNAIILFQSPLHKILMTTNKIGQASANFLPFSQNATNNLSFLSFNALGASRDNKKEKKKLLSSAKATSRSFANSYLPRKPKPLFYTSLPIHHHLFTLLYLVAAWARASFSLFLIPESRARVPPIFSPGETARINFRKIAESAAEICILLMLAGRRNSTPRVEDISSSCKPRGVL